MKKGTTLFLKLAVILIGIPVLALGIWGVFDLIKNPVNPEYAHILYPIVIGIYVSAIPFYMALYQALRILGYIDKNEAFSEVSIKALSRIKKDAIVISIVYVLMVPFIFLLAQIEDAPGLILFGMVPIFASIVIAVFAAVLQRLLQQAIDIKSENDLTV
ncbi:DUF2975 domain-containing protein [Cytobacillus oceanisediminis]|uniref:DUF2975 domain-containing protein n=1 Tax=Niallia alba TaxID=2729105 RepID=A0A7Y0K9I2_9BACI|nr:MULTISPECIES: DUF2975 domain-containing protein [Bacillaceae]MBZ9536559.1 DUF2975 domain-containing protein [Cytobacillus oceanisediminis]MDU1848493.1 DUF2975 domain-containing protein [Niallia nealsonii]NMO77589.1 DUF2975 domain-containing protein [Niallia alba]